MGETKPRKRHWVRKSVRKVAHTLWFGMEISGATINGDGPALTQIYTEEHKREVTHREYKTDK